MVRVSRRGVFNPFIDEKTEAEAVLAQGPLVHCGSAGSGTRASVSIRLLQKQGVPTRRW